MASLEIQYSMSRRGNDWDNAVAERFFHSLKTECTHHCSYQTREQARQSLFDYIEVFYNCQRLHSGTTNPLGRSRMSLWQRIKMSIKLDIDQLCSKLSGLSPTVKFF